MLDVLVLFFLSHFSSVESMLKLVFIRELEGAGNPMESWIEPIENPT